MHQSSASFTPPSAFTLPDSLPLFVLPSILLLPRGRLPLNIFEPRYRAMVDDALGQGRMIGVIQQLEPVTSAVRESVPSEQDSTPPLYKVGCVGRIMTFSETDKGNYLLSLLGLGRFAIKEELPLQRGYRRVKTDFSAYNGDRDEPPDGFIDRPRLFGALGKYFRAHNITANWDVIRDTTDDQLVTALSMTCPFAPWEQQALLEAIDLPARAQLLLSLIEMASLDQSDSEIVRH